MISWRHSVIVRLALGYGLLFVLAMGGMACVFYIGTAGLLARNIDKQLMALTEQLEQVHDRYGSDGLRQTIHALLTDDKDIETEVYLLLDPQGHKLIGNLTAWPPAPVTSEQPRSEQVNRLGHLSTSRLLTRRFNDGDTLWVGRDLHDLTHLRQMIVAALSLGGLLGLLLAGIGVALFQRALQRRLATIQRTTGEVSAGHLERRIHIGTAQDEFASIARDINAMLDEIQHLMDAARDVSNAIAHDLRTPLGRIRGQLEGALQTTADPSRLRHSAQMALTEMDALIGIFEKLLQIAEAEAGVRRQRFATLPLRRIADDLAELYQPAAEAQGKRLQVEACANPTVNADPDLLANVVANLLDNALKYAGAQASIRLIIEQDAQYAYLIVQDDGPGIPTHAIGRATERFFRLDASRHQQGNGLGLSIVAAVIALHHGRFSLADAKPGLSARIALPLA